MSPLPALAFRAEEQEHWLATAEAADRERAVLQAEQSVHELQVVEGGLGGARLLGLPPDAGPLVAAVLYSPDCTLRREAMDGILDYLRLAQKAAAA